MSDAWSKVSPSRRSFLQKLVGTTFVVPLLSSFSMSGPSEALADRGAKGTIGKAEMNVEFKVGKPSDDSAGKVRAFTNKNKTTDEAGRAMKGGGGGFTNKNKTTDEAGRAMKGGGGGFTNKNKTTDEAGRAMKGGGGGFTNKNKTTDEAGRARSPLPFKVGKPSDDSAGKGTGKAVGTTTSAGTSATTTPGTR